MSCFKKNERILKNSEFCLTYKKGKRAASPHFFLSFVVKDERRLGITVSNKVGNAPTRNRIKRVIREYFRLNKDSFPTGDILLTAKSGAAKLESSEIRREIQKLNERVRAGGN